MTLPLLWPGILAGFMLAFVISLDDVVLALQHRLDRLIRRLRRGAAPARTHRRLLIVQIDGLARAVLEEALASGRMPFLRRRLRRGAP